MKTLVHCWKHPRGYCDFVGSTMMLALLFPDDDVTWALPPDRDICKVLRQPQCELYRKNLDCRFLSLAANGAEANRKGKEEFCANIHKLNKETIFCDFRCNGSLRGANQQFKAMLEFEPSLAEKVKNDIRTQFGHSYTVIHVRVGDDAMKGMPGDCTPLVAEIEKTAKESEFPVVLISDSLELKSIMRSKLMVSESIPFHSGRMAGDAHSFMLDVCMIQHAARVVALSTHAWQNTSFSRIPALFAGVPYQCRPVRLHAKHRSETLPNIQKAPE